MSTREEKLVAARKKLREYQQNKGRDINSTAPRSSSSSISGSPSPSIPPQEVKRVESPVDQARLVWERRETLPVNDSRLLPRWENEMTNIKQNNPSSDNVIENLRMDCESKLREAQQIQEDRDAQFQEQLGCQSQAIAVLVAERNDAQNCLSRVQAQYHEQSGHFEELKQKYIESIKKVRELEQVPSMVASQLQQSIRIAEDAKNSELTVSNQKIEMLEEQISELRQKLELKVSECDKLNHQLKTVNNDLSVAEVKIKQLSTAETPSSNNRVSELELQNSELMAKVGLLERRLQAAAMEGAQSAHRFQVYVDQCNSQITSLYSQIKELTVDRDQCTEMITTLRSKQTEMEAQLSQMEEADNPLQAQINSLGGQIRILENSICEKDKEIEALQSICTQHSGNLSESKSKILALEERLQNAKSETGVINRADSALLAAMESDKVAASRAVAQNQKLKEQLTELELAFVRVSNEKSELMEKLSQEEHQNKQLNILLNEKHQETDHSHDHDHCSDDNHSHYHDDEEEESDVDSLRMLVRGLKKDKTELMRRLDSFQKVGPHKSYGHHDHIHDLHNNHNHDHHHDHNHDGEEHKMVCDSQNSSSEDSKLKEEVSELRRAVEQLQSDKSELLKRLEGPPEDPEIQNLLELKLKKTMNEIAALDEEKQRLEHLVLQLQGETETIGEYISLYQKQRLLLKQRSLEKDEQLVTLAKDREDLKAKLLALNEMVEKLVTGQITNINEGGSPENASSAAEKIRDLITEIGSSHVVNSHAVAFEHCSCCSGRLITV